MKRYLIISLLALAACGQTGDKKDAAATSQLPVSLVNNPHSASGMDTVSAARKPVMTFKETTHDFGKIKEDEKVETDFSFTNTGKSPLVISYASGSCGCTIPDYPKDPIAAGGSGIIKVTFNSKGKSGHQEKSVNIRTNTMNGAEMVYIKADIETKK